MTGTVSVESLKAAKEEIKKLVNSVSCGPILIRLAWHDAGTYDDVRSPFSLHFTAEPSFSRADT
jgi:hypothetical protein